MCLESYTRVLAMTRCLPELAGYVTRDWLIASAGHISVGSVQKTKFNRLFLSVLRLGLSSIDFNCMLRTLAEIRDTSCTRSVVYSNALGDTCLIRLVPAWKAPLHP